MLQDYCRRLGIGHTEAEIRDLAASLKALPPDHPLAPLLRNSPDFASSAGVADALLHPADRSYSVPQLMDFLDRAGLSFARWLRQAPYLPWCGALASAPHHSKLVELTAEAQYAAIELFRGTMVRHSLIAYRNDRPLKMPPSISTAMPGCATPPFACPDTIVVRDRLPPGATAVLINRNHTYTDLYLPIDARQERLLAAHRRRAHDRGDLRPAGRFGSRARPFSATLAMGPNRARYLRRPSCRLDAKRLVYLGRELDVGHRAHRVHRRAARELRRARRLRITQASNRADAAENTLSFIRRRAPSS